MKKQFKVLLALACVLALAGTAAASSIITTKTLEAQYMNIRLTVDGREVTPKTEGGAVIEPFMVDGTVYLPVRAVGEALGRGVEWDPETHTVALISPYLQDARELVGIIESTHPCFVLDDVPEGYGAAKAEFLAACAQPGLSSTEFAWQAMAYTSSLKDGHTQMWDMVNYQMPRLVVQWAASGGHLYLLDKDGKLTAKEVTKIGGLPLEDAFAAVDKYFAAENQAFSDKNHSSWLKLQALLVRAGADCAGDSAVLTVLEKGKTSEMTVEIAAMEAPAGGAQEVIISYEQKGDVFYVDFNACVPGDEMDAAAEALAKAVKDGTKKVIIDVRGNGGGASTTCEQLLQAMGMQAPEYSMYLRISELAKQTYPDNFSDMTEDYRYTGNPGAAVPNPEMNLVVLTDAYTFSSGTMMGVFVQDGKLGTLIGTPSANAPSSYGDVLPFKLTNTQFQGGVSFKQWQRPDASADQKTLVPDVVTGLGEDALETALNFLKDK